MQYIIGTASYRICNLMSEKDIHFSDNSGIVFRCFSDVFQIVFVWSGMLLDVLGDALQIF